MWHHCRKSRHTAGDLHELEKQKITHHNTDSRIVYVTDVAARCNILLYNSHFYFINDIDKLVCFVTKRRRFTWELCITCLHYFDNRYTTMEKKSN